MDLPVSYSRITCLCSSTFKKKWSWAKLKIVWVFFFVFFFNCFQNCFSKLLDDFCRMDFLSSLQSSRVIQSWGSTSCWVLPPGFQKLQSYRLQGSQGAGIPEHSPQWKKENEEKTQNNQTPANGKTLRPSFQRLNIKRFQENDCLVLASSLCSSPWAELKKQTHKTSSHYLFPLLWALSWLLRNSSSPRKRRRGEGGPFLSTIVW